MCARSDDAGSALATDTNSSSSAAVSVSLPIIEPNRWTTGSVPASPPTVTSRLAASSSGPIGDHSCQAAISRDARSWGHLRWNEVAAGSGTVRSVRRVTTPRPWAPAPGAQQPKPAAERLAADPDRGAAAGRDRDSVLRQGDVEVAEPEAGPHDGQAVRDVQRMHRPEVQHHPGARRAPREVVP